MALTASLTLLVIFIGIAAGISGNRPLMFDEPILLFLHAQASPLLTAFFTTVTHLGDSVVIILLIMGLAAYYTYRKMYHKALFVTFGIGGVVVANTLLKSIFQRERPALWAHLVNETNFSFPSGHAMLSAAFATMLVILFWETKYRWLVVVLATVGTVIVGLSRLYLGVHYPSDILAGWCVSAVCVLLVSIVLKFFYRKKHAVSA